jgi:superfamily II DNA/RNA helicase
MKERYDVAPLLLQNLGQFGYKHPTAIQAQGVSILLEVISLIPWDFPSV